MAKLDVEGIHTFYGNIEALKGVSLRVEEGEIVTLIGANGAGKTSTLNSISGLLHPRSGRILLDGEVISGLAPHQVVARGVSQAPEGRRIFSRLKVIENLEMGAFLRNDKAGIAADTERIFDMFPRLRERRNQVAGTLSGGEQQMLAIGRALMARPSILLLDEPSMGLAPLLVREIFSIVQEINREGTTVLLVEQNAHMALSVASRAYVIQSGRVVLEGSAAEVAGNPEVRRAYLGEG
ncbi:MAG: ABC transporter ATP-binding protein [Anaerolineae bacterium]|jgi:branched-chain amino acid transport system ATP-binding protein